MVWQVKRKIAGQAELVRAVHRKLRRVADGTFPPVERWAAEPASVA
jgi:hypothetical protein